jgi:hypothetical protein
MAIKPILFNTEMVQAILDGRKTCTRRVAKNVPDHTHRIESIYENGRLQFDCFYSAYAPALDIYADFCMPCFPPYQQGDILYVRETWCRYGKLDDFDHVIEGTEKYYYLADGENPTPYNCFLVQRNGYDEYKDTPVWHPSIHMPKEAARIWLKVTDVRAERLQDIKEDGVLKEGVQGVRCDHVAIGEHGCTDCLNTGWLEPPIIDFMQTWDSTIKKSDIDRYGWDANPWVWVIEFERCEKPKEE